MAREAQQPQRWRRRRYRRSNPYSQNESVQETVEQRESRPTTPASAQPTRPLRELLTSTEEEDRQWGGITVSQIVEDPTAMSRLIQEGIPNLLLARLSPDLHETSGVLLELAGACRNVIMTSNQSLYSHQEWETLARYCEAQCATTLSQWNERQQLATSDLVQDAVWRCQCDLADQWLSLTWLCIESYPNTASILLAPSGSVASVLVHVLSSVQQFSCNEAVLRYGLTLWTTVLQLLWSLCEPQTMGDHVALAMRQSEPCMMALMQWLSWSSSNTQQQQNVSIAGLQHLQVLSLGLLSQLTRLNVNDSFSVPLSHVPLHLLQLSQASLSNSFVQDLERLVSSLSPQQAMLSTSAHLHLDTLQHGLMSCQLLLELLANSLLVNDVEEDQESDMDEEESPKGMDQGRLKLQEFERFSISSLLLQLANQLMSETSIQLLSQLGTASPMDASDTRASCPESWWRLYERVWSCQSNWQLSVEAYGSLSSKQVLVWHEMMQHVRRVYSLQQAPLLQSLEYALNSLWSWLRCFTDAGELTRAIEQDPHAEWWLEEMSFLCHWLSQSIQSAPTAQLTPSSDEAACQEAIRSALVSILGHWTVLPVARDTLPQLTEALALALNDISWTVRLDAINVHFDVYGGNDPLQSFYERHQLNTILPRFLIQLQEASKEARSKSKQLFKRMKSAQINLKGFIAYKRS